MTFKGYRKPEPQPIFGEDTRMDWRRTPPPEPVKPEQKVGPVAPSTPRQPLRQRVGTWSQVAASSDPWGQIWKMRELKARVAARMHPVRESAGRNHVPRVQEAVKGI